MNIRNVLVRLLYIIIHSRRSGGIRPRRETIATKKINRNGAKIL